MKPWQAGCVAILFAVCAVVGGSPFTTPELLILYWVLMGDEYKRWERK